MKALLLPKPGDCETMTVGELPIPEPGPGEIRVKVRASGLNPSDFQRAGYELPGAPYPFVLGIDVAGVVDAIGPDVRRCEIGDRVAVHNDIRRRGGFEEYAVVDARATAIIPDNVSFTSAAAVPSAGLTAYQAIDRKLQVTSSDTVLITGAGGGVGGFAAQLAASRGAHVIGVASGKHEDRVRSLGAHEFIDYRTTDVGDRVREITDGQGVDAVLDVVGADSATEKLQLLAFAGRIATTAGDPDFSTVNSLDTGLSWFGLATGLAYVHGTDSDVEELALMLEELFALVRDGEVDPMVTSTISLDEVPHRLAEMAEGKSGGKTVAVL